MVMCEKVEKLIPICDEYGELVYEQNVEETIKMINGFITQRIENNDRTVYLSFGLVNNTILKIIKMNGYVICKYYDGGFVIFL